MTQAALKKSHSLLEEEAFVSPLDKILIGTEGMTCRILESLLVVSLSGLTELSFSCTTIHLKAKYRFNYFERQIKKKKLNSFFTKNRLAAFPCLSLTANYKDQTSLKSLSHSQVWLPTQGSLGQDLTSSWQNMDFQTSHWFFSHRWQWFSHGPGRYHAQDKVHTETPSAD